MPRRNIHILFIICIGLVASTVMSYWPVMHAGYINFDDGQYVAQNPDFRDGLTLQSIKAAFTKVTLSNWHPLTMLSHGLDCQLFGQDNPAAHHRVNVGLHAANAVLLLLVLLKLVCLGVEIQRMPRGSPSPAKPLASSAGDGAIMWRCALVAGLFALHPLHVESVAWVSERKDLLSTFWGLLAIWCYADWVARRSAARYVLMIVCYALSLMSKPMLVTLPCLLLVLDFWPLGRWQPKFGGEQQNHQRWQALVIEKLPLLAMAAAMSVVATLVQGRTGAVGGMDWLTLEARIANAVVAYATYLAKTVWPVNLAILYPHPVEWPAWRIATSATVLVIITAAALLFARGAMRSSVSGERDENHQTCRDRLAPLAGWLWYLGTLVPVIGLVQVGVQSMADRYTYIPLIGVFIMVAWSVPTAALKTNRLATGMMALAVTGVMIALSLRTFDQAALWQDSETLYTHTLAVTEKNFVIHSNLGQALLSQGRLDEAERQLRAAITIKPGFPDARQNLGALLLQQDRLDEAAEQFLAAAKLRPDLVQAHLGLGLTRARQGRLDEAAECFEQALRLQPNDPMAKQMLDLARQQP